MMNKDVSPLQYMRAHGQQAGPTQRLNLTGSLSGAIGSLPALLVTYYSGALQSESSAMGLEQKFVALGTIILSIAAGALYALIFQRAANDVKGGWLFGSGFGFLLWMLGPVEIWQLATGRPLATGIAAMGLYGAYVAYGLVLGSVFPIVNKLLQKKLEALK